LKTCGGLFRIYFYLYALFTNLLGLAVPQAFIYKMVVATGAWGWFVLIVMSILSFAGLIETIINDFLPARFAAPRLLEWRHNLTMSVVICYGALIWFSVEIQSYVVLSLYLLQIVFMSIKAFADVRHRYGEQGQEAQVMEVGHG